MSKSADRAKMRGDKLAAQRHADLMNSEQHNPVKWARNNPAMAVYDNDGNPQSPEVWHDFYKKPNPFKNTGTTGKPYS